jgi:plastocyanin
MRLRKLRNMNRLARMRHAIRVQRRGGRLRRRTANRIAPSLRRLAEPFTFWWTVWWFTALAGGIAARAGELRVSVQDRTGRAVADVVVTAVPSGGAGHQGSSEAAEAVMDQQNLAFVPQVLVVAVGSNVKFPNNDSVSHQVYSFSAAKRFQLPLYKGAVHPPVNFDKPGLVVLGCNIHDQMVGYIYVTDAPYFGKTDAQGTLHWSAVPADTYAVTLWSPFIADPAASLARAVTVTQGAPGSALVRLGRELRASPQPRPRRADWDY